MNNIAIGIDTGANGCIAYFSIQKNKYEFELMPLTKIGKTKNEVDSRKLFEVLRKLQKKANYIFCYVEKVNALPGQSTQSGFRQGCNYQAVLSVLQICKIPYKLVTPQSWKAAILEGLSWKKAKNAKEVTCNYVEKAFPYIDLKLGSKRRKNPHDGVADSICICEFCKKTEF